MRLLLIPKHRITGAKEIIKVQLDVIQFSKMLDEAKML
jgi:hypothetical protein